MSEPKWAVMPIEHYKAACDKIREKTGKTEPILSGELADEIDKVDFKKIDVENCQDLFAQNRRIELMEHFTFNNITNARGMFIGANRLTKLPEGMVFDNCQDAISICRDCTLLAEAPTDWDWHNITGANDAFKGCSNMAGEFITDASNLTSLAAAFQGTKLTKVVLRNSSKLTNVREFFYGNSTLNYLEIDLSSLTDTYTGNMFSSSPANIILHGTLAVPLNTTWLPLTAESAISIITALVDYTGTDKEFTYTCPFSTGTKASLEDLGAVAPNGLTWLEFAQSKGWNV